MRYRFLASLFATFAAAIAVAGQPFTRLVIFGDSLSDVGNTSQATLGIQPGSAYWQGRFSNGPVWIEQLGVTLGLPVVKSRSGGYNYAHGGAETGSGYEYLVIPNLVTQVTQYLNARTPNSTELHVVWAGGNDYLNGQTNHAVPVGNLEAQIVRLYNAGARRFLVPNLPLLGFVPRNVGTSNEAPMNLLSLQHNALLYQRLWTLRRTLFGIDIHMMDVGSLMETIRSNPGAYGLSNVTEPAYNGTTVVPNPAVYAFWDEIHPTTGVHGILANGAARTMRFALSVRK